MQKVVRGLIVIGLFIAMLIIPVSARAENISFGFTMNDHWRMMPYSPSFWYNDPWLSGGNGYLNNYNVNNFNNPYLYSSPTSLYNLNPYPMNFTNPSLLNPYNNLGGLNNYGNFNNLGGGYYNGFNNLYGSGYGQGIMNADTVTRCRLDCRTSQGPFFWPDYNNGFIGQQHCYRIQINQYGCYSGCNRCTR